VGALPSEWRVKSIALDGVDITLDATDFVKGSCVRSKSC